MAIRPLLRYGRCSSAKCICFYGVLKVITYKRRKTTENIFCWSWDKNSFNRILKKELEAQKNLQGMFQGDTVIVPQERVNDPHNGTEERMGRYVLCPRNNDKKCRQKCINKFVCPIHKSVRKTSYCSIVQI